MRGDPDDALDGRRDRGGGQRDAHGRDAGYLPGAVRDDLAGSALGEQTARGPIGGGAEPSRRAGYFRFLPRRFRT
jgi:hypothetical protein